MKGMNFLKVSVAALVFVASNVQADSTITMPVLSKGTATSLQVKTAVVTGSGTIADKTWKTCFGRWERAGMVSDFAPTYQMADGSWYLSFDTSKPGATVRYTCLK